MNSSTTKPQRVLDLDWMTTDPTIAMTLGKALCNRGHVVWRPQRKEWAVLDPVLMGVHWTVTRTLKIGFDLVHWELLHCTCHPEERKEDPCVHKAAVVHHAHQPCEYSFFIEGV